MTTPQPALLPPGFHWKQGESELTLFTRNQALARVRRQRQGWVVELPEEEQGSRRVVVRSAAAGMSLANKWARGRRMQLAGRGARARAGMAATPDPAQLLAEIRALREATDALFATLDRLRDLGVPGAGVPAVPPPPGTGTPAPQDD